jgi:hypothetical protein
MGKVKYPRQFLCKGNSLNRRRKRKNVQKGGTVEIKKGK